MNEALAKMSSMYTTKQRMDDINDNNGLTKTSDAERSSQGLLHTYNINIITRACGKTST